MSLFARLARGISAVHHYPRFYFSAQAAAKRLTDEIILTESCIQKIEEKQQSNEKKILRIEVEGGVGCSGYSYKLNFDETINEDDYVYEKDNKKYVVVDELTLKLMKGAIIDYENVMIRSGFVIADNPNAEKSCSCKVSFSPKADVLNN